MKVRSRLLTVSRLLGKVPSMAYALIYLALIPIFAAIYYHLPLHFYHSTIQYENTMSHETTYVTRELAELILKHYEEQDPSNEIRNSWDSTKVDGYIITLDKLPSAIRVENDVVTFPLRVMVENKERVRSFTLTVRFNIAPEANRYYEVDSADSGEVKTLTIEGFPTSGDLANEKLQQDIEHALFPSDITEGVELRVPDYLLTDLRNYASGVRGMPSGMSGNFIRMLYLSASTITTLGYGDIVPITTVSRLLVSIESIMGIVLIGLFLNALSFERATLVETNDPPASNSSPASSASP